VHLASLRILLVPLTGIVVSLAALAGCAREGRTLAQHFDPPPSAPDEPLAAASGSTLSLARADGRATLVTFGYTACPDVCPTTLSDWRRVRARLRSDAARVRFVFVSIDWRHDTPAGADAFARRFDGAFIGLAADSQQVAALMPAFRGEAGYGPAASEPGHTAYSYVIDRAGRITTLLPFAADPAVVARELREALR
jgi:protein SCO1/2